VVEAKQRHNGDATFQAEILLSFSQDPSGRARTMCIRGPYRPDKSQAEADADELEKASRNGTKAARELATKMKRSRVK